MSTLDSHTPLAPISLMDLLLCYLGEVAIARVLDTGFWGLLQLVGIYLFLWKLSRRNNHQQDAEPDQVQVHGNRQYQAKARHKRWEPRR